jgi:hypothetical protein
LLLKNGNYLYKVPFADARNGFAVLKVYFGSRSAMAHVSKSLENALAGQTSYLPRTRRRVELECLALWRAHGFRVFDTYDDVEVLAPGCPPGGYTLFEYVEAPKLVDWMRDAEKSPSERFAVYGRFLQEWSRRHDLALAEREPRLVHENGDAKHVMILDEGFLWFDFEMVYKSRARVRELVGHEIAQYLWHLEKSVPPEIRERLLDETVAGYPDRERLLSAYDCFFEHPSAVQRFARALERRFSPRASKPTSKYSLARRLRERVLQP